jgi:hypothetical protein
MAGYNRQLENDVKGLIPMARGKTVTEDHMDTAIRTGDHDRAAHEPKSQRRQPPLSKTLSATAKQYSAA